MSQNYFVRDDDPDWKDTVSLKDYVIHLIETKQTRTPVFQALRNIYGFKKLKEIWKDHLEEKRKKNESNG